MDNNKENDEIDWKMANYQTPKTERHSPQRRRDPSQVEASISSQEKKGGIVPCRFFAQGHCAAGKYCPFSHTFPSDAPICRFFLTGTCKYGDNCALSHAASKATTVMSVEVSVKENNVSKSTEDKLEHEMLPSDLLADLNLNGDEEDASMKSKKGVCFGSITFAKSAALGPPSVTITSSSTTTIVDTGVVSPVVISTELQKSNELCAFAMVGKCKYGNMCRNVHGLQCPRCLKYCLHPHDIERNEEHLEECLGKLDEVVLDTSAKDCECGICMEKIALKEDPRFGLLNCDHPFCLSCIRMWRSKHTMSDFATRSCPLCRVVTYFIIPSSTWTIDPVEKQKIIDAYKKKLGDINCKHFNTGDTTCPFGTSCFYAHKYRDGSREKPATLRSYVDKNENTKVIRETRLCDFIDFQFKNSLK